MSSAAQNIAHHPRWAVPIAGVGLGLRETHLRHVLTTLPDIPWFEILADNHMAAGGAVVTHLNALRQHYPLTFHCVGMSLAGTDPLDTDYLKTLKRMLHDYQPAWVSDHLCFSRFGPRHYHDLLPIPYSEESLNHVANRVLRIQDILGRQLVVENVSSYLEFSASTMSEAEFLAELTKETDCALLLDLNNVFVNAVNHGLSAIDFISDIPLSRVQEIHLAGYEDKQTYLLDAHNNRVSDAVWDLYRLVVEQAPHIPTLIEWDNNIPDFQVLCDEAARASAIVDTCSKVN